LIGDHLPEVFTSKMKGLLEDEYPAFLASYDDTRYYGLRVNTLKCRVDSFLKLTSMKLKPIPWTVNGFYYNETDRPGKHPHYHTGLYYIQEPSAMAPVELLEVNPGDKVLDLCAAPGGKSTQIAAKLAGLGMLVVNDIHSDRVKALVKNMELCGAKNAVILNEQPEKLTRPFRHFFDKILIDAPCSGEGMFRKEEEMAKAWQPNWVQRYSAMQRELLEQAAVMLRPGGRIVYSTCTFSPEENEAMIAQLLDAYPEFEVVPVSASYGFSRGRPEWVDEGGHTSSGVISEASRQAVYGTARLWPHHIQGEGHFAAVLQHKGQLANAADEPAALAAEVVSKAAKPDKALRRQQPGQGHRGASSTAKPPVDLELFHRFMEELIPANTAHNLILHGEHVYSAPEQLPDLSGVRVIRPGWYLGSVKKHRFEPSHALAMGLNPEEAVRTLMLEAGSVEAIRYLKGETLEISESQLVRKIESAASKGYCLVCMDGYPAGWGKWQDGILKNEYPAGWRWT
jgi:NOL1/NOP2/sun family putative RNA methylase